MKRKTVESLQIATLAVGSWFGAIPVLLTIIGSTDTDVFAPLNLKDPQSVIASGAIMFAAIVGVFVLDRMKRDA
ncbi:hypothetical protein BIV57_04140 [Mangrovactinospora gilvigrisea]|uniref:Uncharacterized protein n=1 Tax=Mangrovactinospora gilvigrisea TaxID=1428644 RepID=A0A1J7CB50_9ACTN|nr:hypothetical protein [Mangrovactinospora gilvigrisea]OIV38744.1 hypothetical protein BIV57_04140 [Mangrovactinospora gilvigrisea]